MNSAVEVVNQTETEQTNVAGATNPQPVPGALPAPVTSNVQPKISSAAIEAAFHSAQAAVGVSGRLTGRNHQSRMILRREISGPAAKGAPQSFVKLTDGRVFSTAVVEAAAKALGVPVAYLVSPARIVRPVSAPDTN